MLLRGVINREDPELIRDELLSGCLVYGGERLFFAGKDINGRSSYKILRGGRGLFFSIFLFLFQIMNFILFNYCLFYVMIRYGGLEYQNLLFHFSFVVFYIFLHYMFYRMLVKPCIGWVLRGFPEWISISSMSGSGPHLGPGNLTWLAFLFFFLFQFSAGFMRMSDFVSVFSGVQIVFGLCGCGLLIFLFIKTLKG